MQNSTEMKLEFFNTRLDNSIDNKFDLVQDEYNRMQREEQRECYLNLKFCLENNINDRYEDIKHLEKNNSKTSCADEIEYNNIQIHKIQSKVFYLEEVLMLLQKSEQNFEVCSWAYNEGKLRTQEELEDRKDYYTYCTTEFQKHTNNKEPGRQIAFGLIGAFMPFWFPLFFGWRGIAFIFVMAYTTPITSPLGALLGMKLSDLMLRQSPEHKRICKKFENSSFTQDFFKGAAITTAFMALYKGTKPIYKNFNKGWIEK